MPTRKTLTFSLLLCLVLLLQAIGPVSANAGDWHQMPLDAGGGYPLDLAFNPISNLVYGTRNMYVNTVRTRDVVEYTGATMRTIVPNGGMNNTIQAIEFSPNGTLYALGNFTQVDGKATTYIGSWDGNTWSTYSGLTSYTGVFAFDKTSRFYIGGGFGSGANANWVSFWNGTGWTQLPTTGAPNAKVTSLAINPDDQIYATFQTYPNAGGVYTFNGSTWTQVGPTGGYMEMMGPLKFAPDGTLYLGTALRKWDGTNFVAVNPGGTGALNVNDMAFDTSGRLIVVGGFSSPVAQMAMLDNGSWVSLGGSPAGGTANRVNVDPHTNYVYITGTFTQVGSNNVAGFAYYELPPAVQTPRVSLEKATDNILENYAYFPVKVLLSAASTNTVTVNLATADGTALAGPDYAAVSKTVSFAPGETTAEVQVPIVNDATFEQREIFYLRLSSPSNADLGLSETAVTIVDDEIEFGFSVSFPSGQGNHTSSYTFAQGPFNAEVLGDFQGQAQFSVTAQTSAPVNPPSEYKILDSYFEVSLTDAARQKLSFTSATLCVPYTEGQLTSAGISSSQLKLLHYNGATWEDVTTTIDTANHQVCGVTTSFSPFVIGGPEQGTPTETPTPTPQPSYGGQITIFSGILSTNANTVTFQNILLDGTKHVVAGSTSPWVAKDASGLGAGWHVTIAATDFQDAKGHIIPVDGLSVTLTDSAITVTDGNQKPTSSIATALTLSPVPQKIMSAAANTGMGTYQFTPEFSLIVLPNVYAGSYQAVISLDILAAP